MAPAADATAYLINHIVLPLDLPQANDYDIESERQLLNVTLQGLRDLKSHAGSGKDSSIKTAIAAINSLSQNRDQEGFVSQLTLQASLEKLVKTNVDGTIPLEIKAQNAGLLISRRGVDFIFEAFELSPTNHAVTSCKGRLKRKFPRLASKISLSVMQNANFQRSIASALAKMSLVPAPGFEPSNRANTTDPRLVTDYLMAVLAALGEPTEVTHILKHTRDEVLARQANLPWRRSPLWLLVRVTLQLIFSRERQSQTNPHELYKAFGLLLLSRILALTKGNFDSVGSDSARALVAKTIRRMHKSTDMGKSGSLNPDWQLQVRTNLANVHKLMGAIWHEAVVSPKANIDTTALLDLHPEEDIDTVFSRLDDFLRTAASASANPTICDFTSTFEYPTYPSQKVPATFSASGDDRIYQLIAVESWVEQHLKAWVELHSGNLSSCGELSRLMQFYHSAASTVYVGDPTSMSIMYLTLCAIWVQCDTLACREYPLLEKYDPEIQLDELQCLSLPLRSQMERLHEVELYVQSRRKAATRDHPSIFRDFGEPLSFAVKYFDSDQGISLRELLAEVERVTGEKVLKKCNELADLKRQYCELIEQYNSSECEYETIMADSEEQVPEMRHSYVCSRCTLKSQAAAMDISIYEKPLSSIPTVAKATIFELKAPESFTDWRDATQHLIYNVLELRDDSPRKPARTYGLDKHKDLLEMLPDRHSTRRIVIVSSAKSSASKQVPLRAIMNLEDTDVCLENELRYAYYDKVQNICIDGPRRSNAQLIQNCTFGMPADAKALAKYLARTPFLPDGVASNDVIADQTNCPTQFSLDEFKSFATVPLGSEIMLQNILVQLAMPGVDFTKPETHCMMQQVVQQTGPPNGTIERTLHCILQESKFSLAMLEQLEIALRNISENWESWSALATFSLLARRILSLSSSDLVIRRSLDYLLEVRRISLDWLHTLDSRALSSTNQEQRIELHLRTLDIALLCIGTFDIDNVHLLNLFKDSGAVSALVRCSITVSENHHSLVPDSEGVSNIMYKSWKRLMYRLLPTLREQIRFDNEGLNQAILVNWATFQPVQEIGWTQMSESQCQWLYTTSSVFTIHFDLLKGELLVNGKPLTRLPAQFTQHETYARLFGSTILEVGPSDAIGMDFSARSTRRGYELHFGMRGEDMLLTAVKHGSRLKILPSRLFEDVLPYAFVSQYVHWYDCDRDEVIFREHADPWSTDGKEWRLQHTAKTWRLLKDLETFVNITAKTATLIMPIFRPLEESHHIHITWNTTEHTINISLPRLQLEFFIIHGTVDVRSRQYRGMIVATDQNLGTLVGLKSKLVLRGNSQQERMVLIPLPERFGADSVRHARTATKHQAEITITRDGAGRICAYTLNPTLRRIDDNGDLQSKLLLAYLHALTSHCLPDPFTGYTGTESGLSILECAATRSFEVLTAENISLLTCIGKIAPARTSNADDIQQINWDMNLPFLSQDPGFLDSVKAMIGQARQTLFLYPGNELVEPKGLPTIKSDLEDRDRIRSSTFRVDGYGAEAFTSDKDEEYTTRDADANDERSQRAFTAATLIVRDCAALDFAMPNLTTGLFKSHLGHVAIRSYRPSFDPAGLRFDSTWLGDSSLLLSDHWCSLHQTLPKAMKKSNKYDIVMWLSTMAYSETANMDAIQAIAGFYRLSDTASVKPPIANPSFDRSRGSSWVAKDISKIINKYKKAINECPEGNTPKLDGEVNKDYLQRLGKLRQKPQADANKKLSSALRSQWPCSNPSTPSAPEIKKYIRVSDAMSEIKSYFKAWYDNMCFNEYLDSLSTTLALQQVTPVPRLEHRINKLLTMDKSNRVLRHYAISDIFATSAPVPSSLGLEQSLFVTQHELFLPLAPSEPAITLVEQVQIEDNAHTRSALKSLQRDLTMRASDKCKSEGDYAKALRASCTALEQYELDNKTRVAEILEDTPKLLQQYLSDCESHFESLGLVLAQSVQGQAGSVKEIALSVQQAPRISPSLWLKCLTHFWFESLTEPWKDAIIAYACAITRLQRARRMTASLTKPLELAQEIQNIGHTNWSPREFPETLLLEAESGILVREVQEVIASQMRAPPRDENAVCQLNMGDGKSSVIVPIVAAALADKNRLVRVIIAKPQSKQMLQVLVSKLGRLLNRRVYQLPFSRENRFKADDAKTIQSILEECMEERGVILTQPEHILSFKLMSIENVLIERQDVASLLLQTQQFLLDHTRDIVDEADENFSPHFELVYTMGSQQAIDFAPERWMIIMQILALVFKFAPIVKEDFPVSIEVQSGEALSARVRLLRDDATNRLLELIAQHIVRNGLTGLSTRAFSSADEQNVLNTYISQPLLTLDQIQAVEGSRFWTESTKHAILLVRGLIACGILRFVLTSKRWRVNYGLDPDRKPKTLLAVPYRFKDGPSRAEYSHPDVLILLTLLSYYYAGLNDEHMFQAFQHLFSSDQAALEYNEWIATSAPTLPEAFRTLSGINLKDRQQCIDHVFPHLKYSRACIDYFLSRLVFSKEIRQFAHKLSASGWDLGEVKQNPTTGFSGTKDTMALLPIWVKHLNLQSMAHINALVLGYLLNTSSVTLLPTRTESTDAHHVLKTVVDCKPEVRVVLDCGAAILEQSNQQVVQTWLRMTDPGQVHAAVFFQEEELSVLDRTGRVESFLTSPFAKQLDVCVVYLDEAHTRGTDLRLPLDYRACLTLGRGLSKDKLIQGCMRMRQLGKGQSVNFLVPEEVATKISEITKKDFDEEITIPDILVWSISETWADLRKSMALWAVQGHRSISQGQLSNGIAMSVEQAKEYLEDEGQTVEARYAPGIQGNSLTARSKNWDLNVLGHSEIIDRCKGSGAMRLNTADLEEEQERELAPEQEEERQVELPKKMEAAVHGLHANLLSLVKHGLIPKKTKQFLPAFQALESTSAAKLFKLSQFPSELLVTADFMHTVKKPAGMRKANFITDSYQRAVQWVLSVPDPKKPDIIKSLVIISPHEANMLLPRIRGTKKVTLHLFSPRVNSSYAPLDALDLYTIGHDFVPGSVPRTLTAQLNLFAGSLYLSSYAEYTELCNFLGLLHSDAKKGQQVNADGFITPATGVWKMKTSPVPFLRALLMRIRKEGEGLEKTHLGKILNGVRLEESDFETDVEMSGT
ncbi:hypothetical protein HBI42_037710 [Parastagonospora nodorum]|nr:hypothetical protein HBI43_042830 [Parastagonospora nodorum]KAH6269596.1 hypothetical protein HBI42_037710 [Parastagonospora nodorum]